MVAGIGSDPVTMISNSIESRLANARRCLDNAKSNDLNSVREWERRVEKYEAQLARLNAKRAASAAKAQQSRTPGNPGRDLRPPAAAGES